MKSLCLLGILFHRQETNKINDFNYEYDFPIPSLYHRCSQQQEQQQSRAESCRLSRVSTNWQSFPLPPWSSLVKTPRPSAKEIDRFIILATLTGPCALKEPHKSTLRRYCLKISHKMLVLFFQHFHRPRKSLSRINQSTCTEICIVSTRVHMLFIGSSGLPCPCVVVCCLFWRNKLGAPPPSTTGWIRWQ